ncbi:MAG: hypothetical protein WC413_00580 [Candidatus Nanoarchaeia archaeon]
MEKTNLEKEYSKYKTKYSLSDFNSLDKEFELSNVNLENVNEKFLLDVIRRRMSEKLIFVCNNLQAVLMPNPGVIVSIKQNNFFDEVEKENISKLLSHMMIFERRSASLEIESKEEENAKFIKEFYQDWNDNKDKIKKIFEKLIKGWESSEKKEKVQYFG